MRISDWSSDVCSSDLGPRRKMRKRKAYRLGGEGGERRRAVRRRQAADVVQREGMTIKRLGRRQGEPVEARHARQHLLVDAARRGERAAGIVARSDARRLGKEV